jgi:hypothetical protein
MTTLRAVAAVVAVLACGTLFNPAPLAAAQLPAIKAGPGNQVPACVTPAKLTEFLRSRHGDLDPRLQNVAHHYATHGKALGLRWDYAFFQMVVETNWLRFFQANGRPGLVSPDQNNFAGIGATGRGHAGEAFDNVSTGVLAHLQHISMYAGEEVENPVANRTRLVQSWGQIPSWAHSLRRAVTYTDLTRKWSPYDRGYSDDIAAVAAQFFERHCTVRYARNTASVADGSETDGDDTAANAEFDAAPAATAAPVKASVTLSADPMPTASARTSLFRKLID